MTRYRKTLPFGAEALAPDRTRFRLWAPSCDRVDLVIGDSTEGGTPMQSADGGWFALEAPCSAGTHYRFRVHPRGSDALVIPDPASRLQAGDVHDPSIVVDPKQYAWQHGDWRGRPWEETVLYELHVGLAGGFVGATALLPHLAALGVTAIELMPIADFAGPRNWGYDGVLPYAPDTSYGTPDELKALVDAAHGLGLMMFLDVVYNHFGPDGNYLGAFADAFFRDDIKTPWGRAIDFRKSEVSDFFADNAMFWLDEYRFDGLRFDATHAIVPQDWLHTLAERIRATVDAGRHVHLVVEHEDNAAHLLEGAGTPDLCFDAQWNDDAHHVLHVMLTGERDGYYVDFATAPAALLANCLSQGFIYQGQASEFRQGKGRGEASASLPPTAFVNFLQNHDQIGNRAFGERLTVLARPAALEAAHAMLLLSPQIPLLFMGEEWRSTEPYLYFTSFPDHDLAEAVREGRRGEFKNAKGFADPAVRHTIPDPNDPQTYERSRPVQSADYATRLAGGDGTEAGQALERTRRLLALRREQLVPRLAGARSLGAEAIGDAAVVARWALGDGAVLTMAVNLGEADVAMPGGLDGARQIFPEFADAADRLSGDTTRVFIGPAT